MWKQKDKSILNLSKTNKVDSNPKKLASAAIGKPTVAEMNEAWVGLRSIHRNVNTVYKRKPDPFAVINDDDDDFQKNKFTQKESKAPTFIKPVKKRRILDRDENNDNQVKLLLDSVKETEDKNKREEVKERCPYCDEILDPVTKLLRKYLNKIKRKDQEYMKKQIAKQESENAMSSFSKPLNLMIEKRHISNTDKHEFCKLHRLELVLKPLAKRCGYPESIDFDAIGKRIENYKSQLDDIIAGRIQSKFKNTVMEAYDEFGAVKARSAISVLGRVENCLPGYYGSRGSVAISDALTKLYLQTGLLTKEITKPQLPLEYIQQILVPEVGLRLIREDLLAKSTKEKSKQSSILDFARRKVPSNLTETAEKVMTESREYGIAMFPLTEEDTVTLDSDDD